MNKLYEQLTPSEDRLAARLRSLDTRARALAIHRLLAHVRVAVTRLGLTAANAKRSKPGTKAENVRLKRLAKLRRRLQESLRQAVVCERALRVVLVRRAIAASKVLRGAR